MTPPNLHEKPLHIDVRSLAEEEIARRGPETMSPNRLSGVAFGDMLIRSPGRILLAAETQDLVQGVRLSNIALQVTGPQDLDAFVNPSPSLTQNNWTLPHIRTAPAHVILHSMKDVDVDRVRVLSLSPEPLQGMHGLWLEHVTDERTEGFRCYPLQPGFETILRR